MGTIACSKAGETSNTVTISASSTVSEIPSCGEHVIRPDGIGKLKLGMRADSAKAVCHVAFDTIRPGPEGMTQRILMVAFPPNAVEAEVVNDSIWRLNITTPGIETADSIGVGSPLRKLLERSDAEGLIGEGIFVVIFQHRCGISFVLRGGIPPGRPRVWKHRDLLTLSQDTPVERIMVYKCAPGGHAYFKTTDQVDSSKRSTSS
jgi:hypothetical protein